MKQLFSLFILAIFAAATSFAAEVELTSFKMSVPTLTTTLAMWQSKGNRLLLLQ